MQKSTAPKDIFEKIAKKYADKVDDKAIHVYYERPHLWSLLPNSLAGLNILDIGCGSGWYSEQLIKAGANVTALDGSATMVELAKQRLQDKATVYLADLEETLDFLTAASFDIILAPIVIHYVKDWYVLFARLAPLLKSQGQFIFSTHQPFMDVYLFNLKSYFDKVEIIDYWKDVGEVKYYHHTLHELAESLYQAGFYIERMLEPQPLPEMQNVDPEMYHNASTKPWLLFVKAVKKI
jgi:2-polyprenyl-3-methyl-5-hydroxy-6-metoxy-1,4-benzoquinol methylase